MISIFSLLCACPIATEPGDIAQLTCVEDFGQIQKAILQRTFSTGTTLNQIAIANAGLLATWQALQSASNSTKVVWTNSLGDPQSTPGAAITFGSGNQVPNGAPIVRGSEPTAMAFTMYSWTQAIVAQLKAWRCEEASVYFINQDGQIGGFIDSQSSPAQFRGIPIVRNTMHVGDKQFGGFGEPDRNAFQFSLKPNWSDNFYVVTPAANFDALAGIYG